MPDIENNNKTSRADANRKGLSELQHDTPWHQSLSFKFILIVVVLLSSLMSIFTYLNYQKQIKELNIELRLKGESLARLTALAVVDSVLSFDFQELEKPIVYLNNESDIVYAIIYSAKKEGLTQFIDVENPIINDAIAANGSNKIEKIVEFLKGKKSIEHIQYPISYNEFNLGHVAIGMSRNSVIDKSSELLYQKMQETLFLIIILCITIYFLFSLSTLDPIRRLIKGLRHVSIGEFDYHVNINSKNEIGSLAESFNRMVDELRQVHKDKEIALAQLKKLNKGLESDVEAGTHALTEVNKELEYVAMHDSLTQLPNRDSFFNEVTIAIERANRKGTMVGLVMMDLDSFKEINESKGHDVGDEILITIANRLERSIRGNDCVGRLGGDEFVVLIDNISEEHLKLVAEKVVKEIEPAVVIAGKSYFITASMGLAIYPLHAHSPNDLLRCADIAMYKSKERKDEYTMYDSELEIKQLRHVDLLGGLRVAIQEEQLFLEYQPKIDINRCVVCGVEALVRWMHPERGTVPPYEFISLAENTGLIKPLTAWVLDEAIRQNSIWNDEGLMLTMSVNLSMLNLEDESLPSYISSLLQKYSLPANQLVLEVTETMIMANPSQVLGTLTTLHEMGIHLSIDDFGTGYSSLAHLHKLPVDEVKIDRSFVLLLNEENMYKSIVHSIIELGHNLSLSVVAEGVEDVATVLLLSKLHCDIIQGFYFSKPLSANDLNLFCSQPIANDSFVLASKL